MSHRNQKVIAAARDAYDLASAMNWFFHNTDLYARANIDGYDSKLEDPEFVATLAPVKLPAGALQKMWESYCRCEKYLPEQDVMDRFRLANDFPVIVGELFCHLSYFEAVYFLADGVLDMAFDDTWRVPHTVNDSWRSRLEEERIPLGDVEGRLKVMLPHFMKKFRITPDGRWFGKTPLHWEILKELQRVTGEVHHFAAGNIPANKHAPYEKLLEERNRWYYELRKKGETWKEIFETQGKQGWDNKWTRLARPQSISSAVNSYGRKIGKPLPKGNAGRPSKKNVV